MVQSTTVSPALLCALQLTDNIRTAFWLFGDLKKTHTHHPGAGLGYQGRWREKLKMQEEVNQANGDVDWTSTECDRTILIYFSSNARRP